MAASLSTQFSDTQKRGALIDDALIVLDDEVKEKSGLSGMAVKTAFKLVKGVKPTFLKDVVSNLLPDFLEKMDPVYQKALAQGLPPGGLLLQERGQVASALLSVTDKKAQRAQSELVKKTYTKLRPTAQKHVEAAIPRLAALLNKHAEKA